ncbi:MAG: hypothetical protein ACR2KL_07640 [Nocardioidaceae bacterium]
MAPLTLAGIGWLLVTLGITGPLGLLIAVVGWGLVGAGMRLVRWRHTYFGVTFWTAVAGGLLTLALVVGIYAGPLHLYAIAAAEAVAGYSACSGVLECAPANRPQRIDPAADVVGLQLRLVRVLLVVMLVLSVLMDALYQAGRPASPNVLALVAVLTIVTSLWLGVLLFVVARRPTLQQHPVP